MKKLFWLIIILTILVSGCAPKQEDKLVIGIIKPSLNHLPLDMALKMGYLDKSTIEIKQFAAGWETNEALISGQIDVAILPFTYIWIAVSQAKPVKIVSFLERESDGIITSSRIDSITQLDDKKIGLLRSSTLDLFWEILAEQKGLDFQPCYFRTPMDMVAALQSGNVDALSFYIPSIYMLGEDFNIIHWYGKDLPFHPCCDLAVNTDNISLKEEKLRKLLKALNDGCEAVGDNYETRKLISTNYGLDNNLISPSLKNIKYRMGLDEEGKKVESIIAAKMLEKGYIKTKVDPSDVYLQIK
jgi:ABC-type nitrate/sulfonate/bicarbonate transport system substrate-binding protein